MKCEYLHSDFEHFANWFDSAVSRVESKERRTKLWELFKEIKSLFDLEFDEQHDAEYEENV